MRRLLEEALDKHLPNSQHLSGAGLPNIQHGSGAGLPNTEHLSEARLLNTKQQRGGSLEHLVPQSVNYKDTKQQEQSQRKKPQQVGLWLLARKSSKAGKRVDSEGQKNPVVASAREGRQVHSADPGALMYLPLGGSKSVR